MLKRTLAKVLILLLLTFAIMAFDWETKQLEPVRVLKIVGVGEGIWLEDLKDYPTQGQQTIVEVNGVLIAPFEEYQTSTGYVLIDRVPIQLKQAFIAIEDSRFYSHEGFDPFGFLRALTLNIKNQGYLAGGSTITQQLAKNMFLTQDKKITRKVEEVLIALRLEKEYSKEQILEMYLNQIYFGPGIYGVNKASESFFAKDVESLTLAEAALLAGIPKNPKAYSPTKNFPQAKNRQEIVLSRMETLGFITAQEKAAALKEKLVIETNKK